MIIKRTLAYLSMITLLSTTSIAMAEEEMGPYAGVIVGMTKIDDGGYIQDTENSSDYDDSGIAYGFLAGYQFNRHFSIEWSHQDYNYSEFGIERSSINTQTWHLAIVAAYPMNDSPLGKIDIYGKYGIGETDFDYPGDSVARKTSTSDSFIFGGGIQFYQDEHFRIRTEIDATMFQLNASFGEGPTDARKKDYNMLAIGAKASLVYAF